MQKLTLVDIIKNWLESKSVNMKAEIYRWDEDCHAMELDNPAPGSGWGNNNYYSHETGFIYDDCVKFHRTAECFDPMFDGESHSTDVFYASDSDFFNKLHKKLIENA